MKQRSVRPAVCRKHNGMTHKLHSLVLLATLLTACGEPTRVEPNPTPGPPRGFAYIDLLRPGTATPGSQIIYLDTLGLNPRVLATSEDQFSWLSFSTDATRLAFVRYIHSSDRAWFWPDRSDIFVMSADGGAEQKLTNATKSGEHFLSPDWSPDGRKIAYIYLDESAGQPGSYSLWVMNADGSNKQKIYDGVGTVSWSPDGKWLLTGNVTRQAGVAFTLIRPDGSEIRTVPRPPGFGGGPCSPVPCITTANWASAERIGFTSQGINSSGAFYGLYTIDLDGTDLKQVVIDARGAYEMLTWSADGSRIAIAGNFPNFPRYFYLLRADGSRLAGPVGVAERQAAWRP
jgi:Tol biopolymer transport system component